MPRVVAGVAAVFDKTFQREAGIADGFVGHDDEQHTAGLQEAHHPCDAGGKVFYEVDHVQCKTEVDAAIGQAITGLRSPQWSYSWADIARVLGTTRQAAQQRYGGAS